MKTNRNGFANTVDFFGRFSEEEYNLIKQQRPWETDEAFSR